MSGIKLAGIAESLGALTLLRLSCDFLAGYRRVVSLREWLLWKRTAQPLYASNCQCERMGIQAA